MKFFKKFAHKASSLGKFAHKAVAKTSIGLRKVGHAVQTYAPKVQAVTHAVATTATALGAPKVGAGLESISRLAGQVGQRSHKALKTSKTLEKLHKDTAPVFESQKAPAPQQKAQPKVAFEGKPPAPAPSQAPPPPPRTSSMPPRPRGLNIFG